MGESFVFNLADLLKVFDPSSHWSFDHQLEAFGVDVAGLKEPASKRIFRAWIEEWEKESMKVNCPAVEARFLEKYKNLVFWDPDYKVNFVVHPDNLEFRRGRDGGWQLIGNSCDDRVEDEPFSIELAVRMIGETNQAPGVEIVRCDDTA